VVRVAVSYHEVPTFAQKRKNKPGQWADRRYLAVAGVEWGKLRRPSGLETETGECQRASGCPIKSRNMGGGTESSVLGSTARHSRFQVGVPTWWAFDQWWELEAQKRA
jgi:hypothetical protein